MASNQQQLRKIAAELTTFNHRLVKSDMSMRALLENSPYMTWLKDADGRYTMVNKAYVDYVRQEDVRHVIGKTDFDLWPKELANKYLADDAEVMSMQRQKGIEESSLDGDKIHWLETFKTPVIDDGGNVLGITGFTRDITERKQAEEKLQLAASVFTHAREGILITTADGTIIDVNTAFCDITGYSRDEVLGQNPRLLSSGRQEPAFYAAMWRDLLEKGNWHGEILNRNKNGEVYPEMLTISAVRDIQGATQHYVALFSDISQIKAYQKRLEHSAYYDALTGLPNRVLLADRLRQGIAQTRRRGQGLAVAFLDLDGFKAINDQHGHEAGDQLLIALATRMKQALREGDTLARIGGDEFVAVLLDLGGIEASEQILTRMLEAAAEPVHIGDLVLQVSASLGVTFYPQTDDIEADQLIRQADQAMYQAKLAGKNRYQVSNTGQEAGTGANT
jgi:diguanylate cyclase (GGDEF)-like protein/PAS domain S-box-containing protein